MKRNLFFNLTLVIFAAFSLSLSSCSDDDDNAQETNNETSVLRLNQLKYIQSQLVRVDSVGNLELRVNGEPLTEFNSDTTVVFIGAEDLAEAKEIFEGWLPQGITTSTNGDNIVASPTDTLGRAQGKVVFAPATENDGRSLATVTFTDGATIPYVSKVVFISSSTWPENGLFSPYTVGDIVTTNLDYYDNNKKKTMSANYVCIRSAKEGQTGLLMTITQEKKLHSDFTTLTYYSDIANMIKTLQKNWDMYAEYLADAGMSQLKDDPKQYFYCGKHGWGVCFELKTPLITLMFKTKLYSIDIYRFNKDGTLHRPSSVYDAMDLKNL